MRDEFFVVLPRPGVLERFPGVNISNAVVAPALEAREVGVCVGEGEGAVDEGGGVGVEEAGGFVRGDGGVGGVFGVAGEVDAVEGHFAVLRVAKGGAVDAEAEGGHGWWWVGERERERWLGGRKLLLCCHRFGGSGTMGDALSGARTGVPGRVPMWIVVVL